MKPTDEQIKEFWKWCGLCYTEPCWVDAKDNLAFYGEVYSELLKSINLNNLFEYAVPKLRDLSEANTLQDIEFHWQGLNISDVVECNLIFDEAQYNGESEDPALALFWAIYEVMK